MRQLQDDRAEQGSDDGGDAADAGHHVQDADEAGSGGEVDDHRAADHHRPAAGEALDEPGGHHDRDGRGDARTRRRRTVITTTEAISRRRRPRWSEIGPPTSWPSAIPTKKVVKVSWTWVAVADRSLATCGNAGTYMSVASGAIAVSRTTVATSADGQAGRVLLVDGPRGPGLVAEVLAVGVVAQLRYRGRLGIGQGRSRTLMAWRVSMAR